MLTNEQVEELTTRTETPPTRADDVAQDAEEIHSEVEKAWDQHAPEAEAEADLDDSDDLREELGRRFPKTGAVGAVKTFLDVHARMQADPVNGAKHIQDVYLRDAPAGPPPESKKIEGYFGEVGTKMPDGTVEYAREGSGREDVVRAFHKVERDAVEGAELRQLQKLMSEHFPNTKFSESLRRILEFDNLARENPTFAAARLGARYGMPIDEEEQAQYKARQTKDAEIESLRSTEFPNLRGRDDDILALVKSGDLTPSGDTRADLQKASQLLAQLDRDRKIHAQQQKAKSRPQNDGSVHDVVQEAARNWR